MIVKAINFMSKLKIFLLIIGVFVITVLFFSYFLTKKDEGPIEGMALSIVLRQSPEYKLSLKSIDIKQALTSDYQLNVPFGYYNLKILTEKEKLLLAGKVAKDKVNFPPYTIGDLVEEELPVNIIVEPLNEIVLYLPFFPKAKKVVITDENGIKKFEIETARLQLAKNVLIKLCGNGICDFNENLFACFKDCRFKFK
ncbi:hypothetical protein A3I50_01315 [Candidatus Roizmanbacteria bacterium RIFCSPLOWO2_02_FULL_37_9]|uniref:Uncharacterized protein n=1 Tax=Candidatus Roizmanbacteria bacterium RIFCSPLOWO2_01_FULL_37_16 TaxID=1802058 RepID=A0A1F7IQ72_9BACT|nr:MAG: hypothetical protein A2859_00035 [Candidatus Roizmanbacteria bacterium RIFCSPHIGHO2_01_FULL_37_16b]OGK31667.1 MAG: hypothetical protein A3F57_02625 [Candidatus Roizmanbacteria bacterium RIFCSPHIGHO2_12_FULL_36_11]OGK45452.1 MAG: hypothetical protein A3B40_05995 [Candidatus Roizmanbacteria bacterium RIFCSPLOWO2_01_FULL_37_16]OGK56575.1 MAG: hypothetical protein A3I50_01315 [Candidatus Roizmanbacteria bacterium RIFCSPLOWO2_02_FULL_37_9]